MLSPTRPRTLSSAYRFYVLAVMTAVYTLNQVDRTLVMLLLQPIKEDLKLSDTQLGFVTGIAFGVFFAVLAVPFGRWADRGNRATITSLAIGLWGLTLTGSVFVTNFLQLVLARVAAAVGESGCRPPTYSLVAEYFPDRVECTRAMTLFVSGGPLSGLLGLLVGGWLNAHYGWRLTFFLMGIPGFVLAILVVATIREPRQKVTPVPAERPALPPLRVVTTGVTLGF